MVPTIRYQRFETTLLLVCSKRDPSNEEWRAWCDVYASAIEVHGVRRLLFVSAGGGPNAMQRKQMVAAVAELPASVEDLSMAACGNAPSVRVVTAALGWMTGMHRIKSFRGEDRYHALAYLGVPEARRQETLAGAKRLEAELAGAVLQTSQKEAR